MGEVSKVDYSSKAKGFNFRDFLLTRDTVHTREGSRGPKSQTYEEVNKPGTICGHTAGYVSARRAKRRGTTARRCSGFFYRPFLSRLYGIQFYGSRVRAVQDSWFAVHARIACMTDGQSARFGPPSFFFVKTFFIG
jgi:hypothetical protein